MSAIVAGVLSQVAVTDTTVALSSTPATGATGDVSQKLYRSTTSGFTPGPGSLVADLGTSLTYKDTGLIPNTTYYYKMVYEDTSGPTDVESNQVTSLTSTMTLSQNQFDMTPLQGVLDLAFNDNTISAIVDPSNTVKLVPGVAVKFVTPSVSTGRNTVPSIVGVTDATGQIDGFINYSIKDRKFGIPDPDQGFLPEQKVEISRTGNVMYLMATVAGNRGDAAVLDLTTGGGVQPADSTGNRIVGEFIDVPQVGKVGRVQLLTGVSQALDS